MVVRGPQASTRHIRAELSNQRAGTIGWWQTFVHPWDYLDALLRRAAQDIPASKNQAIERIEGTEYEQGPADEERPRPSPMAIVGHDSHFVPSAVGCANRQGEEVRECDRHSKSLPRFSTGEPIRSSALEGLGLNSVGCAAVSMSDLRLRERSSLAAAAPPISTIARIRSNVHRS